MNRLAAILALGLAIALMGVIGTSPAAAQGAPTGTSYVCFWRGDLRIIATRPSTQVTIVDTSTGLPVNPASYTANFASNPFVLANAGDSFEGATGSATLRVRVVTATAAGPVEPKPVTLWTGSLEPGLKHPPGPPTPSNTNAWMSYLPALAAASFENGAEAGREFWGFTSRELYLFVRKGPMPTAITIEDVASNVDADSDDSQLITPASPTLLADDGFAEIYEVDNFEDDTVHITANTEISVLAGVAADQNYDWMVTPPSWGAGEDYRELGTLFYVFASRDLTVFPTEDGTIVRITDLSDGDDSGAWLLGNGDLVGDYDILLTDTWSRVGTGVMPRPASPAVRLVLMGPNAPFENDLLRVESDKPVLVYVGPHGSDTFEYADVAYVTQTGPSSFLAYGYGQNGGADDVQILAYSPTTNVSITSLTYTKGFGSATNHDFSIPAVSPWLGGNPTYNDWFWSSASWAGELLRFSSDRPITIMDGDFDGNNYGCFVPFVSNGTTTRPRADAGGDLSTCPGNLTVSFDGSGSFDTDSFNGGKNPRWRWDVDASVDRNRDGDFTNDADRVGVVASHTYATPGTYIVTLTYTDDDGESDTDTMVVRIGQDLPPVLTCPALVQANGDPSGQAVVAVRAVVSDDCGAVPTVVNNRTPGGLDATDTYPCGRTVVQFTATDSAGQKAVCISTVEVLDVLPPSLQCLARIDAPTDAPDGATVAVLATVSDNCDPAPGVTNDRTPNGADASGFYPCGDTNVSFSATDASGNKASCPTLVHVYPAGPPPRVNRPILAVKVPPADVSWSLAPPVGALANFVRMYRSDLKPLPVGSRVQVLEQDVTQTTWLESGGLLALPSLAYYQLVTVSCDRALEGPY